VSGTASLLGSLGTARRFADPASPLPARRLAAGGALPIPPPQLASVLVALTTDADAEVAGKAADSLRRLPDPVVDQVLGAPLHPDVLDWFARAWPDGEERLQKIALNSATSDATFCFVATRPFPRLIELVASNQVRLLRCPALVDALGENPTTGHATIDRILHFLGVERGEHEEAEPPPTSPIAVPIPQPPDPNPDAPPPVDLTDASDMDAELTDENEKELDDDEKEQRSRNIMARVSKMSIMEKMKLARMGNTDARSLLVRDRNKLVAAAAIRNPKITDSEVENYAKSRQVSDEIIRIISNNRQWTRNYPVKLGLVMNPKCPPGTAIKFLNFLTDRDLGAIMRSRDVPGPISVQARRILARKGK
jgi:hypothetical protein